MYIVDSKFEIGSSATLTATGDKQTVTPGVPIEIVSYGVIITTALNDGGSGGMVLNLGKRITAGSDTGRVDTTYGTCTVTTANCQVATAPAGNVIRFRRTGKATDLPVSSFAGPAPAEATDVVLPGQQAILKVTTAPASAGAGLPFVEYRHLPRLDRASTIELIVSS